MKIWKFEKINLGQGGANFIARPRAQSCLATPLSSTYALRLLRSHGLQPRELHLVARTTTVASILYAAPAWWGFAGEGDSHRLERLVARMRRSGYLPPDFPDLAASLHVSSVSWPSSSLSKSLVSMYLSPLSSQARALFSVSPSLVVSTFTLSSVGLLCSFIFDGKAPCC